MWTYLAYLRQILHFLLRTIGTETWLFWFIYLFFLQNILPPAPHSSWTELSLIRKEYFSLKQKCYITAVVLVLFFGGGGVYGGAE